MAISERYSDYIERIFQEESKDITNYNSVTEVIHACQDEFNQHAVASRVASSGKNELLTDKQDVVDSWNLKSEIGRDFGNAIHKTFELWFLYNERPKNLLMASYIDKLQELGFKQDKGIPEVKTLNHEFELVGTIDLIYMVNEKKKEISIHDYKTYNDIEDKKDNYITGLFKPKKRSLKFTTTLQLTIYKIMLESRGWKVVEMSLIQQKGTELINHIIEPDIESAKQVIKFFKNSNK